MNIFFKEDQAKIDSNKHKNEKTHSVFDPIDS